MFLVILGHVHHAYSTHRITGVCVRVGVCVYVFVCRLFFFIDLNSFSQLILDSFVRDPEKDHLLLSLHHSKI